MANITTSSCSSRRNRGRVSRNPETINPMKHTARLFVVYFPIVLVSSQVLLNLLSFVARGFYVSNAFILDLTFGTNILVSIMLIALTYGLSFCEISRAAAWAEMAFAVNYAIVQQDNLYNILFQVIVGVIAIIVTFRQYIKRFPMCRLSLLIKFYHRVIQKRSCEEGLSKWEADVKGHLLKRQHG